jgi:hypothetical protein
MFETSPGFVTPDKYTPVTAAIIFRHENEPVSSLPVIPFRVPPVEPINAKFEPKYQAMSARERKLRDLNGSTGTPNLGSIAPRDLASLGSPSQRSSSSSRSVDARKQTTDLVPSSIDWSFPHSPQIPRIDIPEDRSVRRKPTVLIPSTMPWTTSMSPVVPGSSNVEYRKQANDLLPATMPWTTQISSSNPSDNCDFRRKKIQSEGGSGVRRGERGDRKEVEVGRPVELIRCKIGGVPVDGNEESLIRKVFTQSGIHLVETNAQIDILSNKCKGIVEIVVRDVGVKDRISEIAQKNGFIIVH